MLLWYNFILFYPENENCFVNKKKCIKRMLMSEGKVFLNLFSFLYQNVVLILNCFERLNFLSLNILQFIIKTLRSYKGWLFGFKLIFLTIRSIQKKSFRSRFFHFLPLKVETIFFLISIGHPMAGEIIYQGVLICKKN
mgnify:CR=1 FL=1